MTEKPSVAISYAKILGVHGRQDGYLEGNGYLVSWCVGHLVELAPPSAYGEQYVKWNIADLPILPEKWQYLVSASTKKQFGILKKLMHRADVNTVVNSCDAGREGELIFRLVYEQAGCKKPVSRLWLSSMEDSAVRAGFANLKPSTEYDALYQAALCRERADWMVGMAEIAVLRTHIVNYAKTRPVYDAYRKAGYSKRFLENHRAEITLHKAAKAAFDESNLKTLPKVKELDAEYSKLLTEKKALYPDYRKAKDEMQELLRAQRNVELFFAEEKNTTEKTQSR